MSRSEPKTSVHSSKSRVEVTRIEPRSYLCEKTSTIERWFDAAIDAAALADVFSADSP